MRWLHARMRAMVRDTVIGPEQGYIFSASLDEQWAYVVLLAVSRKYALVLLYQANSTSTQASI